MRRALTLFGIMALGALAAQPSLAQGVIKIGAPLALSGALADEGKKQAGAYELWLERVNAAGGISVGGRKMKVELVTYDYQTDEKRAQQIAERLINIDKVDVMTAPFGSGHTKVVAGVAERYGIPIVAVASAEPVHNQGFKYLFGTLSPSMGLIDSPPPRPRPPRRSSWTRCSDTGSPAARRRSVRASVRDSPAAAPSR